MKKNAMKKRIPEDLKYSHVDQIKYYINQDGSYSDTRSSVTAGKVQ